MREAFDLEWLGGPAEKYLRRLRPGVDELPWGTLRAADYPPDLVDRARVSWTEAAYNEYCSAAAFAELVRLMLEAKAPVDLVGMASDFIADEVLHVELTSRLAMELGGGAPYRIDFGALVAPLGGVGPLERANEAMVRLCCVGEAYSVPMLAGCRRSATHPLTRAVLERIVADEAPHGRLGWLYLDWIADELRDEERKRLAAVALDTLRVLSPLWRKLTSRVTEGVTSEGYLLAHVRELGWMESSEYGRAARDAVRRDVAEPLARYGIELPEQELGALVD
jgi:hypothetical protein